MKEEYLVEVEIGRVKAYVNYNWHRDMTALPYGRIEFDYYTLGKELKFKEGNSTDILWDAWDRTLEKIRGEHGYLKFGSSYIEFLYPGSDGYGFHLYLPYSGYYALSWVDFRDDYQQWNKSNDVKKAYEKYKKVCDFYDNALSKLEPEIVRLASEAESHSVEEYEAEYLN